MSDVLDWARDYVCRTKGGKSALARLTGYNRATISLYIDGKYPAGVEAIEAKLLPLMDRRLCPHLKAEITLEDCRNRHSRPEPVTGAARIAHWRACQSCPHNSERKE